MTCMNSSGLNELHPSPILLMETDGAEDEAPCYPKPLAAAISLFKELKLNALLHGINTSGLSAFNPVERRMAPLLHDISGIILPHDYFVNHLTPVKKPRTSSWRKGTSLKQQKFWPKSGQTR